MKTILEISSKGDVLYSMTDEIYEMADRYLRFGARGNTMKKFVEIARRAGIDVEAKPVQRPIPPAPEPLIWFSESP